MWRFSCKLLLSEHTITKDTQQPLDIAVLLHGTLQLSFKVPKLFLTQHANGWINLAHVILVTASAPILIGHLI